MRFPPAFAATILRVAVAAALSSSVFFAGGRRSAGAETGELWCGTASRVDKFVLFGDRSWEEPERGVDVFLERDVSTDLPLSAQVRAVQDAVLAWDGVACSAMRLRYAGVAGDPAVIPERRVVVVRFSDTLVDEPRPLLAYTDVDERDENGFFVRTEVVLNGRAFAWRDDACGGGPDLAGVVAHELGHALGLAHSDVAPSIMANPWPSDRTWQLREPRPDDVAAICALYPCAEGECGATESSVACRVCRSSDDCGGDLCLDGVCAPFCADDAACPAGFSCAESVSPTSCEGRCVPNAEVCLPATARVGLACTGDATCGVPLAICDGDRGVCALRCVDDADCADGNCIPGADGSGAPAMLCRVRSEPDETCSAAGGAAGYGWFALLLGGWYRRRRASLAVL